MKNKNLYRVEWKHNGNWKMDYPPKGTFPTRAAAELAAKSVEYKKLETRIVKVTS